LGDKELIEELRESLARVVSALIKKSDPIVIPGDAVEWALKRIKENKEKVKFAEEFGMIFGVMKSSDCPEGRMAFDVKEGSDLWKLEQELTKRIEIEVELEKLKKKRQAGKEEGVQHRLHRTWGSSASERSSHP
jgi:hypothetical protein